MVTTSNPAKCCACHEICAGAQPTPDDASRRQGVHPTPWQAAKCCACHEICAGAQPTPDDARAYIRPLGKQKSAAPATKFAQAQHFSACQGVGCTPWRRLASAGHRRRFRGRRSTLLLAKESGAGAALCEPPCVDFVAGAVLCEPPRADFVAGTALCEPPCAEFVAGAVATL